MAPIQAPCGVAFFARDERKCVEHMLELSGAELIESGHLRVKPTEGRAVVSASQPARERGDLKECAGGIFASRDRQLFDGCRRHVSGHATTHQIIHDQAVEYPAQELL